MIKALAKEDFKFYTTLRVRYAEVDLQGIVFNANYLTYIDTAITEYFRAIGYTYLDFVKKHSMDFHVIRSVVEYKAPAHFDDELEICLRPEYEGVKIFWKFAIFRGNEILTFGEVVYASFDLETKKLKKIDSNVVTTLQLTEN
ncbi:MAG TPA: thioesterase family protein [Leptospiraceae bacterium]|nr:thioesterase family protein [Leptospiraceae bacterium]HMW04550.1 thioesterase family protein [Leptospiraceae bacterium]HMX33455.1 thioesterase family protein [Leptospiraceae bacterium]HMY30736.1 thioesterase family protein [Leptospiraceae bacterium]HMZ64314.1 thioesterase family protein [Leptospiraceae bacterium]